MSRDALLVAGGANFPEKRPWEGGTKIWYDRIFVLEPNAEKWRDGGRLPAAGGYGLAVNATEGMVLVGGGDAKQNFADVWLARWNGVTTTFTPWPRLPKAVAMGAGALVGRTLYVAGGVDRPDAAEALKTFFALDLDRLSAGWSELPPWPGPARILPVAGAAGDAFYLFSGARLFADTSGKNYPRVVARRLPFSPHGGMETDRRSPPRCRGCAVPCPGSRRSLARAGRR